jgi:DNA-directed RNA polymerase subunit H (RpoH/RPB5)
MAREAKTNHTVVPDHEVMNEPTTYEIVIRGRASERILAWLCDDFSIETIPGRDTRLVGVIRDAAHLHGVVTQLTSLAIDIVSLTPAEPDPRSPLQTN